MLILLIHERSVTLDRCFTGRCWYAIVPSWMLLSLALCSHNPSRHKINYYIMNKYWWIVTVSISESISAIYPRRMSRTPYLCMVYCHWSIMGAAIALVQTLWGRMSTNSCQLPGAVQTEAELIVCCKMWHLKARLYSLREHMSASTTVEWYKMCLSTISSWFPLAALVLAYHPQLWG